ncbi:MAG TPA: glycogen debranching N-terminal domain-containing protein [Steroidobacteraceae bacterium]
MNTAATEFYILAPEVPVPERTFVLKDDDTFALFNDFGDIAAGARHEEGLYHQGTRFLSRLALKLAGARPLLLSSAVRRDNVLMGVDLTNPDIYLGGNMMLPRGSLHIYRSKLIWGGVCYEHLHVRNFTRAALDISLSLEFSADFADIFEVRGEERRRRGQLHTPRVAGDAAELAYLGLDGVARRTLIECQPLANRISGTELQLAAHLEGRAEQVFEIKVTCAIDARRPASISFPAALALAERSRASSARLANGVETSNDQFNAWMTRSAADLNMLLSETGSGLYPNAGVPWFDTTFGRDGIVAALECLWLAPQVARGVLSFLAATQATRDQPERDAEPGKILHEARRGEMAALGEVPFGRYYGSVDATALYVVLAGAYWRRTDDLTFIETIWPNICAALTWMDRYGDRDGDGFIEYQRRTPQGLVQQGWKDSSDSVFHADGRIAEGPIALCEVQAYTYAARLAAAGIAQALGHDDMVRALREQAHALRERFRARFWCPELGLYALALDGYKEPCRVRASNAGHCLFSGIAAPEHAESIAHALGQDTFFTGWGVRTLADHEVRYNPMAYHNGSVWPHDNAVIAAGLSASPAKDLAVRILSAQLDASTYFESGRLPELFCGFRRREGKAPTSYPVACSPQAWSAAAVFAMLQACLGLTIDAASRQIAFRYPQLPPRIERVSIRNLTIGDSSIDLTLYRYSGAVGLNVDRRSGKLDVAVLS